MKSNFNLDNRPGKKKFLCPSCRQQKRLTRYVHCDTFAELHEGVGKCDRENNCNYHYTPRQYFIDNPDLKPDFTPAQVRSGLEIPKLINFIDRHYLDQSMNNICISNKFFKYLTILFDETFATHLCKRYMIGSSNRWAGANVFWQVDQNWRIRTGKVMLYEEFTGKRIKPPEIDQATDWVHSILDRKEIRPNFTLSQCFFGEHLLKYEIDMPVAIVESEKTATVCYAIEPNYIWLAAGSAHGLSVEKCKVLIGRKVVLFPDIGKGFKIWDKKANELRQKLGLNVKVSRILEDRIRNNDEISDGNDIMDYLLKRNENGKAINNDGQLLIDLVPEWAEQRVIFN